MSIKDEILKLQRKVCLQDMYSQLENLVEINQSIFIEDNHSGLFVEFMIDIKAFIQGRIAGLDSTTQPITKQTPVAVNEPQSQSITKPAADPAEITDPLKFLMKYRGLEKKRIEYASKDGPVQGTVLGLAAPNIRISLDTGFVINVNPKDLKEV